LVVHRPAELPGIEMWDWTFEGRSENAMLTSSYMLGGPDGRARGAIGGALWYRGRSHEVRGDARMLMEPGEVFRGAFRNVPEEGMRAHVILVDPAHVARYLDDERRVRPRLSHVFDPHPALMGAFDLASAAIQSPAADPLEREHLVTAFLGAAFGRGDDIPASAAPPPCDRRVRRASELLRDRLADSLTLAQLAGEVGLSVFHLERSFAARMGVPVHRYRQLARLQASMAMLRRGVRLADVASACGFADQAHMTRTYRRHLHFTPGQYAADR
jgi:AraC-like DNA-binding protein